MAKASVTETKRVRYEEDLYAWTQDQAALLRARQPDGLDWVNLAEEIAAVGGSDRRKLESRLCVVLLHLLKCRRSPPYAARAGARRCAPSGARSENS
jgi:hypothetical protein